MSGKCKFGIQSSVLHLVLLLNFWSPVPNCGFEPMQAYYILDEVLIAGELQESSKKSVARVIAAQVLAFSWPFLLLFCQWYSFDNLFLFLISMPSLGQQVVGLSCIGLIWITNMRITDDTTMISFMVSWNVLIPYWEVLHSPFCAVFPQALTQLQFCSFPRVGMGKYNDTEKHKHHMWTELSALSSPFASLPYLLWGVIVTGHIDWQCQRAGQLIVQHDCTSHKVNYSLITSPTFENSILRW